VQAGDRILDVDGTTVTGVADLQRLMNEDAIGRAVRVRILRKGAAAGLDRPARRAREMSG
jgi:S1-C subfamily serine protease